jgi:uncharacterized protein YkwD
MDLKLRQRLALRISPIGPRQLTPTSSGFTTSWSTLRNRQKVLGFAAAAVSLVLVSAPFLLNVDGEVIAKAQTIPASPVSGASAQVVTEIATFDDVISSLNAHRSSSNLPPLLLDEQLQLGAQGWAQTLSENGNVRNDQSLRSLLEERPSVGEFVVAAPNLALAYQRLTANPAQHAQLLGTTTRNVGVGAQTTGNKTYLVIRFG